MARPLRVLIANDSALAAEEVVAGLERGGFSPHWSRVASEAELASALSAEAPDLILSEHGFAGPGVEVVLDLRNRLQPEVPVIVVSAAATDAELGEDLRRGAQDAVAGPARERLALVVERELGYAASRRSARECEQRLRDAEHIYRRLVEEIPALTYVAWADEGRSLVYVSPQLRDWTGYSPAEWLAEPGAWAGRIHADDRERALAEYKRAWTRQEPFVSEYRIVDARARVRWWRDEGRPVPEAEGRPRLVRGFVVDVTERKEAVETMKEAAETIRRLTHYDPLTGLPNRTHLQQQLGQALAAARQEARSVALLFMAVDRYREIRTTLGDGPADQIVRELAARLGHVLGGADRVARVRGDEFATILPVADARLALQVAASIHKSLEAPFVVEKLSIEVGMSIGIAAAPEHGDTAELLLRRADTALEAARRAGNGAVVYSEERDPYDPRALVILGELRRALEAEELTLHYQPRLDLHSRRVVGAEALLRWRHPRLGAMPPDRFIPLAEQGGLIKPLTRWVLAQAVAQCDAWRRQGRDLAVSVNLSARNLEDPGLVDHISGLLAARALPPRLLRLELTESAVMADYEQAANVLGRLTSSGVEVAVDDYGTGYSSLARLRRLPVSELKIDKTFVMGMTEPEQEDAAIVRSTSELGHNLRLAVVAEGVESGRTLDLLSEMGCDGAQGYYIARPMPAADLEEWLATSSWGARLS
jgi:diguanylate cyclase (GGDEF)-like protein/PAS domain S-box-containing protein